MNKSDDRSAVLPAESQNSSHAGQSSASSTEIRNWYGNMKSTLKLLGDVFGHSPKPEGESRLPSAGFGMLTEVSHISRVDVAFGDDFSDASRCESSDFSAQHTQLSFPNGSERLTLGKLAASRRTPPAVPNRFILRKELGRGGFGVVYHAFDSILQRDIAIKVPHPHVASSLELRKRFLKESRATARLNHPNIVKVLEGNEFDELPYQVSELIVGQPLTKLLRKKQRLSPRSSAALVQQLALGVAHAHLNGIVHRDIKPDNILIAEIQVAEASEGPAAQQTLVPLLTDFGLAQMADDQGVLTLDGTLVGTPRYMAPEQLSASADRNNPSVDIFALGLILYETLTGTSPYAEISTLPARVACSSRRAFKPEELNPAIPRDLSAICMKCLEIHSRDRYRTAAELAEDLARYLDNRPTIARPISSLEKMARCISANRLLATLFISLVGLTVVFTIQTWLHLNQIILQNQETSRNQKTIEQKTKIVEKLAEESKQLAARHQELAFYTGLREAWHSWEDRRICDADWRIKDLAENHSVAHSRQEFLALRNLVSSQFVTLLPEGNQLHEVRSIPGSPLIVTAGDSGLISLVNLETGQTEKTIQSDIESIHALAVSPDGRFIAAGGGCDDKSHQARILMYDLMTGQRSYNLPPQRTTIESLIFSGDSRKLACGCRYEPLAVFDLTQETMKIIPAERRNIWLSSDSDGRWLAGQLTDNSVTISDLQKSDDLPQTITFPEKILLSQWIPGTRIMAVAFDRKGSCPVRLVDTVTLENIYQLECPLNPLTAMTTDEAGGYLYGAAGVGQVLRWKIPAECHLNTGDPRSGKVDSFDYLISDQRSLIPATFVGTLANSRIDSFCVKDNFICVAASNGSLSRLRCPMVAPEESPENDPDSGVFRSGVVHPGLAKAFLGGAGGDVRAGTIPGRDHPLSLTGPPYVSRIDATTSFSPNSENDGDIVAIDVSRDGQYVAWGNRNGVLMIKKAGADTDSWKLSVPDRPKVVHDHIFDIAIDPESERIAWTGHDRMLHVARIDSPETSHYVVTLNGWGTAVAFSPDGRTVACGGFFDCLLFVDVLTGETVETAPIDSDTHQLEFLPDGQSVIGGFRDGSIRRCSKQGKFMWKQMPHTCSAMDVAISSDGRLGASVDSDSNVCIWMVQDGGVLGRLSAKIDSTSDEGPAGEHNEFYPNLVFTPDDEELLLLSQNQQQRPVFYRWIIQPARQVTQN